MMKRLFPVLLSFLVVSLFSCEQAQNPVGADMTERSIAPLQAVGGKAEVNKTPVAGGFELTGLLTWGEQGYNPGGNFFIRGLEAEFETGGDLPGPGWLYQDANYSKNSPGPTFGAMTWTVDWNGESVMLSGRWQGTGGTGYLEVNLVAQGRCSTGPVTVKVTIEGPSFGPFTYSGMVLAP